MRKLTVTLILSLALVAPVVGAAAPTAVTARQASAYRTAMTAALQTLQVKLVELGRKGTMLQVSYQDDGEQESAEFVLAAVVTLALPLAEGSEQLQVAALRNGRRLAEWTIEPGVPITAYCPQLGAAEQARLAELAKQVRSQCELTAAKTVAATASQDKPAAVPAPVAPPATAVGESATAAVPTPTEPQQLAEALLARLRQANLENLRVSLDSTGCRIAFENRTYRSDLEALLVCLREAAEVLPPMPLELQPCRDNVPVNVVRLDLKDYAAAEAKLLSADELQRRTQVTAPEAQPTVTRAPLAQGNSSRGKFDLALRPAVHYEIGNETKSFLSDEFVLADLDSTLAQGLHLNLQSATQLDAGLSSKLERALLTKTGWLSPQVLATTSFGKFDDRLYGWYGEAQWDLGQHRLGVVANALSDGFNSPSDYRRDAVGYYEYEDGRLGLTVRLAYGRYFDSATEAGILSLQRRFGESVLTTEAIRGEGGEESIAFRVSLPFGPRCASAPSALRLRSNTAFDLEYHSDLKLTGNYLQGAQSLSEFRGELSPAYVHNRLVAALAPVESPHTAVWPQAFSLEGASGLIRIPTADVLPEGTVLAEVAYIDDKHTRFTSVRPTNVKPLVVGFGLLPGLEINGRLSILNDVEAYSWSHNLDRSMNLHYRLRRQRGNTPALAVGLQDASFGTVVSYIGGESRYLVSTWADERYRLHLGYGTGRLQGLFGGLDLAPRTDHKLHLLMDYDTEFLNAGLRLFLGRGLSLDMSLLGMETLSGSVAYRTALR